MRLAIGLVTMSKRYESYFYANADIYLVLVKERNEEIENELVDMCLKKAAEQYPDYSNFKVSIRYVPENMVTE